MHIPSINESIRRKLMKGGILPTIKAFNCRFCLATIESALGKIVIFLECVENFNY
jgi:hypothetical protein